MNKEEKIVPQLRFPEFEGDGGWNKKPFEKLFKIGSGRDYKHLEKGDIPVYGTGGYMLSVNDFLYDGKSACIGRKGTINKPMLLSGKFWTVDTLFYTHSFKDCSPEFVYLLFLNINWLNYNEAGGVPSLSKDIIRKIEVFIPKPKEQQKIAACLSSLDEVLTAETEKLDLLQDHKKGLLQQLFPAEGETQPKFRFPEFKEDGDWVTKLLGDLVEIKGRIGYRGYTKKDIVEKGKGAITLSPSNFDDNGKLIFEKATYITWEKYYESPEIILEEGQTVLVKTASVGKSAYVGDLPEKATVNPQIVVLKPKKIEPKFLAYTIFHNYIQNQIANAVGAGAIPNMSQASIAKLEILLPKDKNQKEQQKIAQCLTAADELIEAQTQKIEALQEHKKGLLQQLFPTINELAV